MVTRLLSAAVGVVVLLAVVLSGSITVLGAALAVCTLIGMYELYKTFGQLKRPLLVIFGCLLSVGILFSGKIPQEYITALAFVYVIVLVCHLLAYRESFRFEDFAIAAVCPVYVAVPLYMLFDMRCGNFGFFLLWIALGGAWVTDSFAYFSGMLFGKHKLCPNISPKKTIEGSVGGTVCTVVIGLLYGFLVSKYANIDVNYISLGVLSLICAVVSQLGDLTASVIKREKGIKDFGNLMPGHGGFMDRFDSTLFVAPAVYIFNLIFPVFF